MKETGVLNFVDTVLAFSLDNWDTHFRPSEIQSLFIRNKWLSVQSFSSDQLCNKNSETFLLCDI